MSLPKRHRPGSRWRFLAWNRHTGGKIDACSLDYDDRTEFDELVVDAWLHIEQMSDRVWWMEISRVDGSALTINVVVGERGLAAEVHMEEDV